MKIENVTNTSAYTAVIVAWRAVFREYIYMLALRTAGGGGGGVYIGKIQTIPSIRACL